MWSKCNIELGGKGGQTFIKEVKTLPLRMCTLAELHLFFCHRYPAPEHDNCTKVQSAKEPRPLQTVSDPGP